MSLLDLEKILKALVFMHEHVQDHPVIRVLEGRKPERGATLFFKEAGRLVVSLGGTGRYCTVENGVEMAFDLKPGQIAYFAPCTWSCPIPVMPYRSLAITLRPGSVNFSTHARKAQRPDGSVPWRTLARWQTAEGLEARGEQLLQWLEEPETPLGGENLFNTIVGILLAELLALLRFSDGCAPENENLLWHCLCDYIGEHWSDPSLTRETLALAFNRHPNHISRFFHKHAKQNLRAYLNEIRLKRSLEFLGDIRYNVTEVALRCGFSDPQYFIRCFRKRFGMPPGQYRNYNF